MHQLPNVIGPFSGPELCRQPPKGTKRASSGLHTFLRRLMQGTTFRLEHVVRHGKAYIPASCAA